MKNVYKKGPIISILSLFVVIVFVVIININEKSILKVNNEYEIENNYSDLLVTDIYTSKNFNFNYNNISNSNRKYKLIMYLNDLSVVIEQDTKFEIISNDKGAISHYGPLYPYGINYNEIVIGEGYFVPGLNSHNYTANIETNDRSLVNYIEFKIELE